jgi:acid stress-induced BolA-like protein IbaG/YrbA
MTTEQVRLLIERGIPGAQVSVSGENGKFEATIVSEVFENLTMVKEHQLVFRTVQAEIASGELHALTIKAYTPAEWGALKSG